VTRCTNERCFVTLCGSQNLAPLAKCKVEGLCQVQSAPGRRLVQPEIWDSQCFYGTQRARFRKPLYDWGKLSFNCGLRNDRLMTVPNATDAAPKEPFGLDS